jgi:hypothetical protein
VALDSTPFEAQPAEPAADSAPHPRSRRSRTKRFLLTVSISALLLVGLIATGAAFDADHAGQHALAGLFGGSGGCGGP